MIRTQKSKSGFTGLFYLIAMTATVFSGFCQMPIARRYFINEIPGFSWTANPLTALEIHIITASILAFILAWQATEYLLRRNKDYTLTFTGKIRALILMLLIISGLAALLRNPASIEFSNVVDMTILLSHLFLTVGFLIYGLICMIFKANVTRAKRDILS